MAEEHQQGVAQKYSDVSTGQNSIFNSFSLFKPGAKAGFYYDTTSSCFYLFISAPFLISDKNIMTAEEKGIFPQVFLVMIFKFTFFDTKIPQVLYMFQNLSSIVFITYSASLGKLWKHTLAPVEGKQV